ncbi:MAG TPA: hypothetical protein P5105_02355 [Victivallales bacterium]|nr:hypothetical protein [Victivallales bacterium]HRR06101.1 hypothetical protein [Victivallales bacterium]HRR28646.1 hypothetical protein [Victivallales bacterium]
MKKKLLKMIFFLCGLMLLKLCAEENKMSELLTEYKIKIKELSELRQKVISEDEELKNIYREIIELHTKLALKLEEKPEIKALYDKILELEKNIEKGRTEEEKRKILKND